MRLRRRAALGLLPFAGKALAREPGLRALAEAKGLALGCMVTRGALEDGALLPPLRRDAAIIAPGLELKWAALRPGPDRFDFAGADALAERAAREGWRLRGHTLLWHEALPRWFDPNLPAPEMRALLRRHIAAVAGRYAGRILSWDVVNEPVEPAEGRPDGLRATPFLRALGPDHLRHALEWAAEADPRARLVVNDYDLELASRDQEARRTAMLRLLESLRRAGAPVHALGIQAHLAPRSAPFDAARLRRFLREVAGMGLLIEVTELDIVDRLLPADVAARDAEAAAMLRDFLDVALAEPATRMLVLWGLSDTQSWQQDSAFARRRDGLPSRGHPLDREMQPKSAWNAIADALRGMPARRPA